MKNRILICLLFLAVSFKSFSQQGSLFTCPIKKGKIINEESIHESVRKPGAVFEGKDKNVYSCSAEVVKRIDSVAGFLRISIDYKNYFFTYVGLETFQFKEGQSVKEGGFIGKVKDGERLFLIASKDNELIEPSSILRCKVITRDID